MEESSFKQLEQTLLKTIESSLSAQLKAVRQLRKGAGVEDRDEPERPRRKGISQTDIVLSILKKEGGPLHVDEILEKVSEQHGRELIRDSLVSAMSKKIARGEDFEKTARNTFKAK